MRTVSPHMTAQKLHSITSTILTKAHSSSRGGDKESTSCQENGNVLDEQVRWEKLLWSFGGRFTHPHMQSTLTPLPSYPQSLILFQHYVQAQSPGLHHLSQVQVHADGLPPVDPQIQLLEQFLSIGRSVNSKETLSPPSSQHPRENGGTAWEHHCQHSLFKKEGKHIAVPFRSSSEVQPGARGQSH